MGTRGLTQVILDGEYKISQYGQWDHYPSVAGVEILKFLHVMDADYFKSKLRKIDTSPVDIRSLYAALGLTLTDGGFASLNDARIFKRCYPQFDRDMGPGILTSVYDGSVTHVSVDLDETWCEYIYIIDFDTGNFSVSYPGVGPTWPLDNLPTENEFLERFGESA